MSFVPILSLFSEVSCVNHRQEGPPESTAALQCSGQQTPLISRDPLQGHCILGCAVFEKVFLSLQNSGIKTYEDFAYRYSIDLWHLYNVYLTSLN